MVFLMLFLLTGCFGPPLPEKYGGIYLKAHGYSPELIAAIVQYGTLPANRLDELCSIKNKDVKFLLARNPHLPFKYMQYYSNDEDDFIRSGLALNTAISSELVEKLFADKSQTVCDSLAENSAVPQDVLLRLYRERKPALVCFAINSNCPPEIKQEILKSNDALAQQWLRNVESWNKKNSTPLQR
jgi:hypothetical protein